MANMPLDRLVPSQEIRIGELSRTTAVGRVTYVVYKGRTFVRARRRGRPHYEAVSGHGLELSPGECFRYRNVSVNSQIGRALLAQVENTL